MGGVAVRARGTSPAAQVRARLDHPVVDADGHIVEYGPALAEYLVDAGIPVDAAPGELNLNRMLAEVMGHGAFSWYDLSPRERLEHRVVRGPWWGLPADADDLATASLPALFCERQESMGIDFSVMYGSIGPGFASIPDEDVRRAACRAVNRFYAEVWGTWSHRVAPVAVIPMHTPDEAIEELDVAVGELGFRAVVIAGYVKRPIATAPASGAAGHQPYWMDTYGIDSIHDYDPFWQRCRELRVPVASHAGGIGWGSRQSTSSYMYNHIGHFAAAGEMLCKSLFFGGVTSRFPELRFAFLEGGANWARSLLADLVGHWEKRNRHRVERLNPANFDRRRFETLLASHGGPLTGFAPSGNLGVGWSGEFVPEGDRDEWAACGIERVEDFRTRFLEPFFFGCEGDDPTVPHAFDRDAPPLGQSLRAMFGSDIGHWDVSDMGSVLAEAHEAVDTGRLTPEAFRALTFANPVRFGAEVNRDFFAGTAVEGPVDEEMGRLAGAPAGPR